ncbi:MAG: amidophosphoribosyltransferase [Kiritimatiellae bacterium]|nr:amidophosphoribosyltransferase [Kiritimatiellia bacterium]
MHELADSDEPGQPREGCGVFGVFGVPDAAPVIFQGLFALQHRGQEGAGIVVSDGRVVRVKKGPGLVGEVFSETAWSDLPGDRGIGHVRYSTTGSPRPENIQPLVVECLDGIWAIAHNGNLVNAASMRRMYQEAGAIFQTTTDSEILIHLLADPMYRMRPRPVGRALGDLKGAFAFLMMTKNCVMAARDPLGFKPLSIGRLGDGLVFASETCALVQIGAEYVRDVQPGELVVVDGNGMRGSTFFEPEKGRSAQCIFEHVYFARPDSIVFGRSVHAARLRLGERLAEEHPAEADIVIAVPDSGNSAALGFSRGSGIPLDYGFIRNHYVGRTFIMPSDAKRKSSVDMKLAVVSDVVRDKRVVVVDDSIIRGHTARRRIECLRKAGASQVHMRVASPPTTHPCFFGIDFATTEELIAADMTVDQIRDYIRADSLGYISVEGLLSAVGMPDRYCTACFSGDYPVEIGEGHGKAALESAAPLLDFSANGKKARA